MTAGEDGPHAHAAAARHYARAVAENLAGHPARGARQVVLGLTRLGVQRTTEPDELIPAPAEATIALVTRLLATLAKSEVEMTGLDQGLATIARAARWAERSGNRDAQAFLRSQRGLILFRGGRFTEARLELDAAIATMPDTAVEDKWRVLLNRGALLVETGDVRSARGDLARCLQLARRFHISVAEGIALHNLGCLEFIAGDLPRALKLMDAAMHTAATTQEGLGHLDRSRVLLAAGLQREADEALAVATSLLTRERCWQDVAEVELTRAESALLAGDAVSARRLAARARDRFRRHGNDRWRRNAELVLLQADLRHGRPMRRLLPHAERLAAEFDIDGFPLQARTAWLLAAELEQRLGELDRAAALAAEAGMTRSDDPIAVRLHTRYVHARLALATNQVAEARRGLRAGLAELAAYQSQFGGIDVQSASAVHGIRLAELDLAVALRDGAPCAVLAAVERRRAASRRLPAVTPPEDEVTAELLSELRLRVQNLQSRSGAPAAGTEVALERRRVAELQRELRSRSWQTGGTGRSSRPATVAALRDAMTDPQQNLISYLESQGQLHAITVQRRRARLVDLGSAAPVQELAARVRADLDVLASDRVAGGIAAAALASVTRSLAELDHLLLGGLGLPGGRLVIIPTGPLFTLPWSLLPSLRGLPIEVAPSATAWLRAVARRPEPKEPEVVALAGPGLRSAIEEVRAIGTIWPQASVLAGTNAAPGQLRRALATADLVHVAAHGEHQPESPMFSSLHLAGGPAFAYELDQTKRMAPHVILSACDLGQATLRAGEESLGLTSVLLHLGAQCVIAGVCQVNDEVAASVMVRYHRHLAHGLDAAAALAAAALGADTVLPAPFVCFGASWSGRPATAEHDGRQQKLLAGAVV